MLYFIITILTRHKEFLVYRLIIIILTFYHFIDSQYSYALVAVILIEQYRIIRK